MDKVSAIQKAVNTLLTSDTDFNSDGYCFRDAQTMTYDEALLAVRGNIRQLCNDLVSGNAMKFGVFRGRFYHLCGFGHKIDQCIQVIFEILYPNNILGHPLMCVLNRSKASEHHVMALVSSLEQERDEWKAKYEHEANKTKIAAPEAVAPACDDQLAKAMRQIRTLKKTMRVYKELGVTNQEGLGRVTRSTRH